MLWLKAHLTLQLELRRLNIILHAADTEGFVLKFSCRNNESKPGSSISVGVEKRQRTESVRDHMRKTEKDCGDERKEGVMRV